MGVRFELAADGLHLYRPDGQLFKSYVEIARERDELSRERDADRERAEWLAARLRELGVEPD